MGMQQCTCVSGASWQAGSRFTTAQTQDMASWHVWHKRCALQFWMVRVWEDSCCSHSSCEWQGGRIDCDSSHCGLGADLFLPPGPCSSSTQRKRARCHLSTNRGFLGGRTEFSQKKTFFCHLQLFWHIHTTQLSRKLAGRPQSIEFWRRSDSQSLGAGCGIRRQTPFFNARVSSINPFCLSTYFCYPKGVHPQATLWTQMLPHHWVCQSLVTNQPRDIPTHTSWDVLSDDLIIVNAAKRSKAKSKEAICDAIILLFLNHGCFKGHYNALHSYPLSHSEWDNRLSRMWGFHLPEEGVSVWWIRSSEVFCDLRCKTSL